MSDACRKAGLKFGVYLSPWDRNDKDFGRPEYLAYYRDLLRELLTNYGDLFMVWFDGASGGKGYYGGAREVRNVDRRTYYDWPQTWSLVRSLQPNAAIFSDAGPDVRWVGSESGTAGDPCWATLDLTGCYPGMTNYQFLNTGHRSGANWVPPECDVPIRPLWFYHSIHDARVKSTAQLVDIYYRSVGRGASLDLGLAPDTRGRIPEPDVASLRGMGQILRATFATNLAVGARLIASNVRGGDARFGPANLLSASRDDYWATDDSVTNAELVIDLGHPTTFNVVRVREFLPLGQRVEAFALDQWQHDNWQEVAHATSIGSQRLLRLQPLTTDRVRLRITQAAACPALSEFGLFAEPEPPPSPVPGPIRVLPTPTPPQKK
jgi:alpha-L-fucosidase